jgi:hypothetical protein
LFSSYLETFVTSGFLYTKLDDSVLASPDVVALLVAGKSAFFLQTNNLVNINSVNSGTVISG